MAEPIVSMELYASSHAGRPGESGMHGQRGTIWLRVVRRGSAPIWYALGGRSWVRALEMMLRVADVVGTVEGDPAEWSERG